MRRCHMGPTGLDVHRGKLAALLPQLVITFHCTFASLLEGERPSSQNMIGQT